jgi:hypothetical protein
MAIRGLKEPHDIDIVVTQELYDEYKQKEGWTEETGDIDTYLQNNGIELWHNWKPGTWDVRELITNAEIIDGLPFVPLTQVLKWKEANARPKDIGDAELIRAHIAAQ